MIVLAFLIFPNFKDPDSSLSTIKLFRNDNPKMGVDVPLLRIHFCGIFVGKASRFLKLFDSYWLLNQWVVSSRFSSKKPRENLIKTVLDIQCELPRGRDWLRSRPQNGKFEWDLYWENLNGLLETGRWPSRVISPLGGELFVWVGDPKALIYSSLLKDYLKLTTDSASLVLKFEPFLLRILINSAAAICSIIICQSVLPSTACALILRFLCNGRKRISSRNHSNVIWLCQNQQTK